MFVHVALIGLMSKAFLTDPQFIDIKETVQTYDTTTTCPGDEYCTSTVLYNERERDA